MIQRRFLTFLGPLLFYGCFWVYLYPRPSEAYTLHYGRRPQAGTDNNSRRLQEHVDNDNSTSPDEDAIDAQVAIGVLRQIDGVLSQLKQSKPLCRAIPRTKTSFKQLLTTNGPLFRTRLVPRFLQAPPLSEREADPLSNTLSLISQSDSKGLEDFEELTFVLYYLNGDLTFFPEDPRQVHTFFRQGDNSGLSCEIRFTKPLDLASQIREGLDASQCGIKYCRARDCTDSDATSTSTFVEIERCNKECDLVVDTIPVPDTDKSDLAYVATVALDGNGTLRNSQFLGLYKDTPTEMDVNGTNALNLLPDFIEGFPINSPDFPPLVQTFSTWDDIRTLVTDTFRMDLNFTDLNVAFTNSTDELLDVTIAYRENIDSIQTTFNATAGGIGALLVDATSQPMLSMNAQIDVASNFQVRTGTLVEEPIILVVKPKCQNETLGMCETQEAEYRLEYQKEGSTEIFAQNFTLPGGMYMSREELLNATTEALSTIINADISDNVFALLDSNITVIEMEGNITRVELQVRKDCKAFDDDATVLESNVFRCQGNDAEGNEVKATILPQYKAHGLPTDYMVSKAKFALDVGVVSLSSTIQAKGSGPLTGSLAGFVEMSTTVDAEIDGDLAIQIQDVSNPMIPFADWLAANRAILEPNSTEHIDGFFNAMSAFNGTISATNTSGILSGKLLQAPNSQGGFNDFVLDFMAQLPFPAIGFDIDFDFENLGDVPKMSAENVVDLLLFCIDFLTGDDPNDTVETCSGGLLENEIVPGTNVFAYQLPVLGVSACQVVSPLQSVVEAVQLLGRVYGLIDDTGNATSTNSTTGTVQLSANTTLQALGNMTETLLQDRLGNSVTVDLVTTSALHFSDLLIDVTLSVNSTQNSRLTINLKELLAGFSGADEIISFIHALTPRFFLRTAAQFAFKLKIGLEYDRQAEKIRPYLRGGTELTTSWFVQGNASLETNIGPIPGSVSADFRVGESESDPLALRLTLDPNTNYYVGGETSNPRGGFVDTDIFGLLDSLVASFSGRVNIGLDMGLLLLPGAPRAELDLTIPDLKGFLEDPFGGIEVVVSTTSPNLEPLTLFDLLLLDPGAIPKQVDDALASVEEAALGPRGVVTVFPVPFIRNAISSALGGNSKNNILGQSRRLIVESLTGALGSLDPNDNADNFIELIEIALDSFLRDSLGLIRPGESVSSECFTRNGIEFDPVSCIGGAASSVVWTVPLGQSVAIPLPLDFSVDASLPFLVSLEADVANEIVLSWSFYFSFGFDETDGFFLYTGREDEFIVEATASVNVTDLDASLLFFAAKTEEFLLQFGASFCIDISKPDLLRSDDAQQMTGSPDRVTIGDIGRAVSPADFFNLGAVAGATISTSAISASVDLPDQLADINSFIPGVDFSLAAQFRKQATNAGASARRRRLHRRRLQEGPPRFANVGHLHSLYGHTDHPAMSLLQSLSLIQDEDQVRGGRSVTRALGTLNGTRLLGTSNGTRALGTSNSGFEFDACPVDLEIESSCLVITNITLKAEKILNLVSSLLQKFVDFDREAKDGILDKIVGPLIPLADPIPGLSDLTQQEISILDVATALVDTQGGKKAMKLRSGVQTVRTLIERYEQLIAFAEALPEEDEDLVLAESCDVLNNFTCMGGIFGAENEIFDGRALQSNRPKKRKFFDRIPDVEGFNIPILTDPLSVLQLLQGEDIRLLEFDPPPLSFYFDAEIPVVIWTPPTITLFLEFSFEATVQAGFVLDTKGIREAIEQKSPIKALNSLALKDTFDGIDEPMITLEGRVGAAVAVNLGISVRVSVGVSFIATIDLFDPNPETSMGLVRPYEVLSKNPIQPFEFFEVSLSIFVDVRLTIKLVFFTLFEYGMEILILGPFVFTPPPIPDCAALTDSGELQFELEEYAAFQCLSLSGSLGQEEVECKCNGDQEKFNTFDSIKRLSSMGSMSRQLMPVDVDTVELLGVQSSFEISSVRNITLDYTSSGDTILADNSITIAESEVLIGKFQFKFDQVAEGKIILPKPESALLLTTVGGLCNSKWELHGHTNLEIKVHELQEGCEIIAFGGDKTDAKLTIDFGQSIGATCFDGNQVSFTNQGDLIHVTINRQVSEMLNATQFALQVGVAYKNIEIKMTQCCDKIMLASTLETVKSTSIELFEGDDEVMLGGSNGLDEIKGAFILDGGSGKDTLQVDDTGSLNEKTGTLTPATILGMMAQDLSYVGFEIIALNLSNTGNNFLVASTSSGTFTSIHGGNSSDNFIVRASQGDIDLFGGNHNDTFSILGLGRNTSCTIQGGEDDDILIVNGTSVNGTRNTLEGSTIRWNGGDGNDKTTIQYTSLGSMTLDVFDDLDGINELLVECPKFVACTILARENFMSNLQSGASERVNLDRRRDSGQSSGFLATASVSSVILKLNEGDNKVFFDGTFAPLDVIGGPGTDEYRFGQFHSQNRAFNRLTQSFDAIQAIETASGLLSVGNSHPVSVSAGGGVNNFDFHRNNAVVSVRSDGDSGLNNYNVRSYNVPNQSPGFTLNSLLYLVGGSSADKLVVVGTAESDDYVVSKEAVRGSGLSIQYMKMNYVEVLGLEGDDTITVLSTDAGSEARLYGGDGENNLHVSPRVVGPVVSKNLKGHQGIIEHEVSSADGAYSQLTTEGVAVNVMDNDGVGQLIIEDSGVHIMSEDSMGAFDFTICPAQPPNGTVVVDLVSQADVDGNRYLLLNTESSILRLEFSTIDCQSVLVEYNDMAFPLQSTDVILLVNINVNDLLTTDARFLQSLQGINPIAIKLIPAISTENAMSVTVVESLSDTAVAEGLEGFNAFYDIYLRPCTPEMRNNTVLTIVPDCTGEITLDLLGHNTTQGGNGTSETLQGDEWNITGEDWQAVDDCKVTVNVAASMDNATETRIHFVRLNHRVTDANGTEISLSDGSQLNASDVLVKIFDRDTAGLITESRFGTLSTSEFDEMNMTVPSLLFYSEYRIRLSKPPDSDVNVTAMSVQTATSRLEEQSSTQRSQLVLSSGNETFTSDEELESVTLVFTPENWFEWQTIQVFAKNDNITEGMDYYSFPTLAVPPCGCNNICPEGGLFFFPLFLPPPILLPCDDDGKQGGKQGGKSCNSKKMRRRRGRQRRLRNSSLVKDGSTSMRARKQDSTRSNWHQGRSKEKLRTIGMLRRQKRRNLRTFVEASIVSSDEWEQHGQSRQDTTAKRNKFRQPKESQRLMGLRNNHAKNRRWLGDERLAILDAEELTISDDILAFDAVEGGGHEQDYALFQNESRGYLFDHTQNIFNHNQNSENIELNQLLGGSVSLFHGENGEVPAAVLGLTSPGVVYYDD